MGAHTEAQGNGKNYVRSRANGHAPGRPRPVVVLPHDETSEAVVLSAILQQPDPQIIAQLSPNDFWLPKNQTTFEAIRKISDDGLSVDILTLYDFFKRNGVQISLRELADASDFAPPALLPQHLRILKRLSELRAVRSFAWRVQEQDIDFARFETEAASLRDTLRPMTEGLSEIGLQINAEVLRSEAEARGESVLTMLQLLGHTGFFVKGWSHILAGYPRSGKTELLIRAVSDWDQEHVLYFTEEPKNLWEARLATKLPRQYRLGHVDLVFALGLRPIEILNRMARSDPTIVVIDSVKNLLGMEDEKDNSEITRVINPYVVKARGKGQTLICVHHARKGGGDHGEGIAGGHAFLAAVDVAIELCPDVGPRRRLRGYARVIDVPELVYEKLQDGTMTMLGSPQSVALNQVKDSLASLLSEEWQKSKDIAASLDPKPSEDQIVRALESLAKEGTAERDPPIEDGKKPGKTYRWRLPQDGAPPPPQTSPPLLVSISGGKVNKAPHDRICRFCGHQIVERSWPDGRKDLCCGSCGRGLD